jgi:hypothetical protein
VALDCTRRPSKKLYLWVRLLDHPGKPYAIWWSQLPAATQSTLFPPFFYSIHLDIPPFVVHSSPPCASQPGSQQYITRVLHFVLHTWKLWNSLEWPNIYTFAPSHEQLKKKLLFIYISKWNVNGLYIYITKWRMKLGRFFFNCSCDGANVYMLGHSEEFHSFQVCRTKWNVDEAITLNA